MHFVKNHKVFPLIEEIEFGIGKPCSVLFGFKVEIPCVERFADFKGERRFA